MHTTFINLFLIKFFLNFITKKLKKKSIIMSNYFHLVMSSHTMTSVNTLPAIEVAINQVINLVHSNAHQSVVSRLLVEALHRPHRELEEMMHALHDYLLGYHLGGKKVADIYINLKIFKPFPIELDPMDDSTSLCLPYASKCLCGGIHCQEWEYDYIDHNGKRYLDMGSFYRSSHIQRGTAHARINWDFLDEIDDELPREPEMSREPSYAEATRTPSPFDHGFDCWCNQCTKEDEEEENDRLWGDIDPYDSDFTKDDPDFSKDDRGGINYHNKRHDKREFRAKSAKKDNEKQSSFKKHFNKKHFKKRGARNPRPDIRRETRNSKGGIKRTRLYATSDEESGDEPEISSPPAKAEPLCEDGTYDNPPMPEQEHFDADLPVKDDRERRLYRKHNYMREKHIRDQEKMARELGIPVARKMKRRDIPTSRYNRHKERFDMENY